MRIAEVGLLYWVFKWLIFTPAARLLRTQVQGGRRIPVRGPAILVSNHISAGDTLILPAMVRRRITFPAKAELFAGSGGPINKIVAWFLTHVGQLPMDRSGGRASATSMDPVLEVLRRGDLLGIYPEGTRSPDGRLYKGKTGVARLVLQAGVPVIPIGMIDTQLTRRGPLGLPVPPQIRIGEPLDFRPWSGAGNDRDVLRYVTDEIMAAVQDLSGQTYVDAYGASVKSALKEGRELATPVVERPGLGRSAPPPRRVPSGGATP